MSQGFKFAKEAASRIADYYNKDITELAEGYIKAKEDGNKYLEDGYIAALILRYWFMNHKMQSTCRRVTLLEFDDYFERLFYCIDAACQYKPWRDDPSITAAQAISRLFNSRGSAEILYQSNLQKEKANINRASLDMSVSADEDKITKLDLLMDENTNSTIPSGLIAKSLIQSFISRNHPEVAIIADIIAFDDSTQTDKVGTTIITNEILDSNETEEFKVPLFETKFSARKVVHIIANLQPDYVKRFISTYSIDYTEAARVFTYFRSLKTNAKIKKEVDKALEYMRAYIKKSDLNAV